MPYINKIEITGFKAFPDKFTLTLEGKHLLMYGENGSGKSTLLEAIAIAHGFNPEGHPFIYIVDKNGFNTTLIDGRHPLPANINGCFINHQFLFHFFNFRNSQRINLFPVFVKDILPFIKDDRSGYHIGEMYDILTSSIIKRGNQVAKEYLENINYFNERVKEVIEDVNLSASDIYNKYFKDNDGKELQIRLRYDSNADKPEGDPMEYWLKYDRIIEYIKVNDTVQEKPSRYKRLNSPFIGMEVSEKLLDGTFRLITNPHVHFNRAKVVDFLLHISDKYRIYLFTHDRAFFEFFKHKSKRHISADEWLHKEIYMGEAKTPYLRDSKTYLEEERLKHSVNDFYRINGFLQKNILVLI